MKEYYSIQLPDGRAKPSVSPPSHVQGQVPQHVVYMKYIPTTVFTGFTLQRSRVEAFQRITSSTLTKPSNPINYLIKDRDDK